MSQPDIRYKCQKCGHACTETEMDADATTGPDDEQWSNWICPRCKTWGNAPDGSNANDFDHIWERDAEGQNRPGEMRL